MTEIFAPINWSFWMPRLIWFAFGGAVGSLVVFVIAVIEVKPEVRRD